MVFPLVTGFYAGLLALMILLLALRVVLYRRGVRIGLGDAGDRDLARRVRAHGNAIEYVPIALLLLLLLELQAIAPMWLHGFGIALVLARLLHAWGLSRSGGPSIGRTYGTIITVLVIMAMACTLIWQSVGWWLTAA